MMKKTIILLLVFVLSLAFISCEEQNLPNDNETSSQSGQDTHEEGGGPTIENKTEGAEQGSNTESPNGNGSSVPSQSETEKSEQKSGTELASESESSLPSQSETEKSEQESSTEIRNTAECQYVSFDEILSNVTDMVKARFVGVTIESGGVYNYEFEVIESLRGMAKEERIIVSDIAADCIVLNSEISFSTYDVKYAKGNSYLLLLRRSSSVYDSEYKFSFAHPSLIIPLDKDRNNNIIPAESTLYGESISKHMGSVEASDALSKATLEEYILNAIKSNPTVKDDGSIDSINMKEILLGSQYVLEVTIEYIDNNPTFANDRVVCNCKVISVLKGDYEKENPTIVFTLGDYKEGETYIVAVNLIDGATILTMSSANSVFSVSQKDEILDIIAE